MKHVSLSPLVLITTSWPDGENGSEAAGSFVYDLSEALAQRIPLVILAPTVGEAQVSYDSGIKLYRFAVPRLPLSHLKAWVPWHWGPIIASLRSGSRALEQVVNENSVRGVLALWALPSGFWAWQQYRRRGIPYATWALGSDIWSTQHVPIVRSVLRAVLKASDQRFADGYLLREAVSEISGAPCSFLGSCREITPPQTARRPSPIAPYRLAFLGRWHPNKGIDILLSSLSLLSPEAWESIGEIRIHGGGKLGPQVQQSVNALRHTGRPVQLGGYLDKEAAVELLCWSDFVVIPSRKESIPVIFSDAMQCGRPVIVAPAGDLPHLVELYACGVCATDVSAEALAKAIGQAVEVGPSRFTVGVRAAADAVSLQATVDSIVEWTEGLIARDRCNGP